MQDHVKDWLKAPWWGGGGRLFIPSMFEGGIERGDAFSLPDLVFLRVTETLPDQSTLTVVFT